MSSVVISDTEYRLLRDLIRERFGINYDDGKQFLLQSRLQTRLIKTRAADFMAYYRYLLSDLQRDAEWDELASVLSNNETYFFRERSQLDVLAQEVVSEALQGAGPLRIWSAACSTGEEPYLVAMTLLDGHRIAPAAARIKAGDLSPRAVEKCAAGFYRELSFRATPPEVIGRYFKPFEGGFFITDEVKRMVEFSRINLLDERTYAEVGPQDVVFCRNVLIYFDKATQKRVVESFARVLRPGGFLFLGHAESIIRLTGLYEPFVTAKAVYYRRRDDAHH
ncbi:MAG: CheR family methyltransferase [Vulcanimicrobiaceae bacterium]